MMPHLKIGTGEPVVLIHGLGSCKEYWHYQHDLSSHYTLLIPDLPGHGSFQEAKRVQVESMASSIWKLIDSYQYQKVHIVGLSLGGLVAQEMYKQRPKGIQTLTLANTVSYVPMVLGYTETKKRQFSLQSQSTEEFTKQVIEHATFSLSPSQMKVALDGFSIEPSRYQELSTSALGRNYSWILPFIHVPVLLLGGREDRVTPSWNVLWMKQWIRNATLHIFPKTGHLSNIEQPASFNFHLYDFLAKNSIG